MLAFIFLVLVIIGCSVQLCRNLFRQESPYWSGPVPSKEQQKAASIFMTEHLQKYPDNELLAAAYPKEAAKAQATRRYLELEQQFDSGAIDEIEYLAEVEKILPLIDISDVLEK